MYSVYFAGSNNLASFCKCIQQDIFICLLKHTLFLMKYNDSIAIFVWMVVNVQEEYDPIFSLLLKAAVN